MSEENGGILNAKRYPIASYVFLFLILLGVFKAWGDVMTLIGLNVSLFKNNSLIYLSSFIFTVGKYLIQRSKMKKEPQKELVH